jgi:hypothetical protein
VVASPISTAVSGESCCTSSPLIAFIISSDMKLPPSVLSRGGL